MIAAAFLYVGIAVLVMACCAHDAKVSSTYAEERHLARYALAGPVWPLLLAWVIGKRLLWLWRAAGFGSAS